MIDDVSDIAAFYNSDPEEVHHRGVKASFLYRREKVIRERRPQRERAAGLG